MYFTCLAHQQHSWSGLGTAVKLALNLTYYQPRGKQMARTGLRQEFGFIFQMKARGIIPAVLA